MTPERQIRNFIRASRTSPDGPYPPSLRDIVAGTGLSMHTVRKTLASLQAAGRIKLSERGRGFVQITD